MVLHNPRSYRTAPVHSTVRSANRCSGTRPPTGSQTRSWSWPLRSPNDRNRTLWCSCRAQSVYHNPPARRSATPSSKCRSPNKSGELVRLDGSWSRIRTRQYCHNAWCWSAIFHSRSALVGHIRRLIERRRKDLKAWEFWVKTMNRQCDRLLTFTLGRISSPAGVDLAGSQRLAHHRVAGRAAVLHRWADLERIGRWAVIVRVDHRAICWHFRCWAPDLFALRTVSTPLAVRHAFASGGTGQSVAWRAHKANLRSQVGGLV